MKVTLQERQYASVPTEGKWFRVYPLSIEQNLFEDKREESLQEVTRQLILEAFEEMKNNVKYTKPFRTTILEKIWRFRTVGQLKELAKRFGDHNADWVEQSLEWAQRIANGESWEDICNHNDTANWYRLVVWKNGKSRFVGGSSERGRVGSHPASYIYSKECNDNYISCYIVPSVVDYDE